MIRRVGESFKVDCRLNKPQLKVMLFHEARPKRYFKRIPDQDGCFITLHKQIFTLYRVKRTDIGNYYCSAGPTPRAKKAVFLRIDEGMLMGRGGGGNWLEEGGEEFTKR